MSGYSRDALDCEYPFCGDFLPPSEPIRDRGLTYSDLGGEGHLAPGRLDRQPQSFRLTHTGVFTTIGGNKSITQSDTPLTHTEQVPKQAKTSPMWERFLAALRDLPHAKSDDQTAIGRAVGVRQTMVSAYKTGDKGPSMSAAIALAAYADMCVEYLLTGKGPIRRWAEMDEQFQHLVQYWERLNDANRAKLLEQAELLFTVQAKHRTPRHLPPSGDRPMTPPTGGKKSSH